MADLDKNTLTEAFVEGLRQANRAGYLGGMSSGGGGGGGGGSGSPMSDIDSKLKAEGKGVVDSLVGIGKAGLDVGGKLFEGGLRVKDATAALEKGMQVAGMGNSVIGKALSTSAELLNKLGSNIDQNVDTWRKLSDTGASFNNDIFEMKTQASNARLSIAEMSDVVQRNSQNLAGLGATVGQSTKEFSKVSQKFFDEGLGTSLTRMGYNTKELNDVLAVTAGSMRLKDLQEKGGTERAAKAAAALATEMDEVAKITGKSKQEQLDEIRRKQADGQRQAAIDLAIQRGGKGAAEAFNMLSTTSAMGGKNFQKLAEDVAAMGRPSEGMEGAYAALGSEAQKLLQEAGAAARSGNQELAQQRVKEAAEARARFQQTEEYKTLAAQGLKEFSDQYGEGKPLAKAIDAAGGSMKDLQKSVKDAQAGIDPDTGKKSPGAAITEFAVDVESRGRDLTKALNDNVTQPLVTKIGPKLKEFSDSMNLGDPKKFKEAGIGKMVDSMKTPLVKDEAKSTLDAQIKEQFKTGVKKDDPTVQEIAKLSNLITSGATSKPVAEKLQQIAKEKNTDVEGVIKGAMQNKGAGVADLNKQLQGALSDKDKAKFDREQSGEVPSWRNKVGKGVAEDAGNALGAGVSALGDLFKSTPGRVEVTNFPTRHEGTLGKTGQLFEPTDFFGIMKKGETMLTPDQLEKFAKNAQGSGIETAVSGLTKSMSPGATTKTASQQNLNVSEISKSISTSISSATSTATFKPTGGFGDSIVSMGKMRLNDDQKKVFDEMMTLGSEQSTARLESLKAEKLAAQATNKSVADARDAIEERYENEGRLAELKDDAEFQRLTKELNSSYNKIRSSEKEIEAVEKAENTKKDLAKLGFDLVVEKEKEKTKIVSDVADKINNDLKDALPINDLIQSKSEEPFDEFSGLDQAIEQQKNAEIQKNTSGMDLMAEDGSIAQGMKINPETGETYYTDLPKQPEEPFDEFKGLDEAIAKQKVTEKKTEDKGRMPSLSSISFGPSGMPVFKQVEAAKQTLGQKTASPGKKINPETGEEYTPADAAKPKADTKKEESKPAVATKKESTLDDVVKGINQLNSLMTRFVEDHKELGNKQIRAVKSNSADLYAR